MENVLLHEKQFKLCDFGSATKVKVLNTDKDFEDFERYTTLMYRPPEMIDKFSGWPVNMKADIWVRFKESYQYLDVRMYRLLFVLCASSIYGSGTVSYIECRLHFAE